nr:MAG TPA: hypothetical protein [Inoviridae sp.]
MRQITLMFVISVSPFIYNLRLLRFNYIII